MTGWPGAPWPDTTASLDDEALARLRVLGDAADEAGSLDPDSLAMLRSAGWMALPVPGEFHGGGRSLVECCALQARLAAADPALAIAVNMHLFSVGLMVEHWRRRTDVSWLLLEAIATQDRLLASAFAEPGLGGATNLSTLRATRARRGWTVSGTKRPCSLAGEADLICLQFQTDEAPSRLVVALLPRSADGIEVIDSWDGWGMRASASHTLRLTECFVPDELVFYVADAGADGDDVFAAGTNWFALTATACYLGLARTALAEAATLLETTRIAHLGAARSLLPSYQSAVGRAAMTVLPLEHACLDLAQRMEAGEDPERLLAGVLALKQGTAEKVPALIGTLMEAVGGRAYSTRTRLPRLLRDATAARFHPPTLAAVEQYVGRVQLGLPASLNLDESAPLLAHHEGGPRDDH